MLLVRYLLLVVLFGLNLVGLDTVPFAAVGEKPAAYLPAGHGPDAVIICFILSTRAIYLTIHLVLTSRKFVTIA